MKEYQFGDYKAIDTGYVIKLFKKALDEFGTWFYKPLTTHRYKEDPIEDKNVPQMPYQMYMNEDYALVVKTLLEENANLKFYNKMNEELLK